MKKLLDKNLISLFLFLQNFLSNLLNYRISHLFDLILNGWLPNRHLFWNPNSYLRVFILMCQYINLDKFFRWSTLHSFSDSMGPYDIIKPLFYNCSLLLSWSVLTYWRFHRLKYFCLVHYIIVFDLFSHKLQIFNKIWWNINNKWRNHHNKS